MYKLVFYNNNKFYARFYNESTNDVKSADPKKALELLEALKEDKRKIKNIYYKGLDLYFTIDDIDIVLRDKNNFIKDKRFAFIFNEIKNKRFTLSKKAIKTITVFSLSSALAVVGAISANTEAPEKTEEKLKNLNDKNISVTYVDDANDSIKKDIEFIENSTSVIKTNAKDVRDNVSVITSSTNMEQSTLKYNDVIDITKYKSNSSLGFAITSDNKKYDLNDSDKDLLMAIIAAECDHTLDDALAVISTILNRCEDPDWINSYGTNPIKQATARNQFVVYQEGYYKKYLGNAPENVKIAVNDALNGVRNHNYLSFRSNETRSYSDNIISNNGNRYK